MSANPPPPAPAPAPPEPTPISTSTTSTTSAAVEPDGPRATRLRALFKTSLEHSIKTCSYSNFAKCFPTPAQNAPEHLRRAWEEMCAYFEGRSTVEWEKILKERNVIESLNQLDVLIREAEERRAAAPAGEVPIPPSTLPPDVIMGAQLAPVLAAAQEKVNARIADVQAQNAGLIAGIEAQRREIEELLGVLGRNLAGLEGAVQAVNEGKAMLVKEGGGLLDGG
ncbi:Nnf1-domain-containing protein [Morchella conica CCBAS932]|uniref:Nnf1-domain-containing protein n=1 Tax=Morchella conica CCBAS932 TaxID=1392247 RepID=A0A3N4L6R6_9PEZI|nr:Nnf1-domain-containing protein [Morchella conica CCBAS932]